MKNCLNIVYLSVICILIFIFSVSHCTSPDEKSPKSYSLPDTTEPEGKSGKSWSLPDTTDDVHLFLYGTYLGGIRGKDFTDDQLKKITELFDAALWLYSGTGVSEAFKEYNPDFLTLLYYDAIFAGRYYVNRRGLFWMPEEDWDYVKERPNMFARNCEKSDEEECLIRNPIWTAEWLMDISDFDEADANNIYHWVNFYAHVTKKRIEEDGHLDGLFIDELMVPYTPCMPENLPDFNSWFPHLRTMAEFIRNSLGDRPIIFNGIQQSFIYFPKIVELMEYTDGALFECFTLCWLLGPYMGEGIWRPTLELALDLEKMGKYQFLQAIYKRGSQESEPPVNLRLLALASYYLVKGTKTFFFLNDSRCETEGDILFLPEWEIDLKRPLHEVKSIEEISTPNGYYRRDYECGIVIVNPTSSKSFSLDLDDELLLVIPEGIGQINGDGEIQSLNGKYGLSYNPTQDLTLEPQSGYILVYPKCVDKNGL